jgi:hypothetical protein
MYKTFTSIRLATQVMTKASSDLKTDLNGCSIHREYRTILPINQFLCSW